MTRPWLRVAGRAVIAWTATMCATVALVGAAAALFGHAIVRWDQAALAWLAEHRSPAWTALSDAVTDLGKPAAAVPLTTFAVLAFFCARRRRDALWVFLSCTGAGCAYLALLPIFGRSRPDTIEVTGLSLPSGHAMDTLALALPSAIAAWRAWGSRVGVPVTVAGAALVLAVGVTRPYIQYHYVSDVLVGWALTAAWVLAVDRWVLRDQRQTGTPGSIDAGSSM